MKKILQNKKVYTALILVVATMILSITSYTKVFMSNDGITRDLYGNSMSLVYDVIAMRYQNENGIQYGLGYLYPYNGTFISGITDESIGVEQGYSTSEKMLVVADNEVTEREYQTGNTLIFLSGDKADVIESRAENGYLYVYYDAEEVYSVDTQGELKFVCVYNNEEDRYMRIGDVQPYESQLGLQGKLLCALPKSMIMHEVIVFGKMMLALLYGLILTLICYGIAKKYNVLFGVVFYLVTLLSPWMIGFSTNLYWVEFSWFLPMLIGLFCANHIDSKKARIFSYVAMIFAVAFKSACGYEYISTIMLGSIVFLLTDLTCALIERKDKAQIKRLFSTTFFTGLSSLMGFVVAILSHAYLRGQGDVFSGLKAIYYIDVCRRTYGDPSMFQDVYADSLNASVFSVVLHYLGFDKSIILGVSKWVFIPLIAISFLILVIGLMKKKVEKKYLVLYLWLGVTAVSWFVLGKAHSYIHVTMNYVMWYFGYMQIIFYVPIQAAVNGIRQVGRKKKKNAAR